MLEKSLFVGNIHNIFGNDGTSIWKLSLKHLRKKKPETFSVFSLQVFCKFEMISKLKICIFLNVDKGNKYTKFHSALFLLNLS